MGTDSKKKTLKSLGVWGHAPAPPPPPKNNSPHQIKIYAIRLSLSQLYRNNVNFFVLTATDWNHLSDDQVKAPTLQDFK